MKDLLPEVQITMEDNVDHKDGKAGTFDPTLEFKE
jgi:hypothetical protein